VYMQNNFRITRLKCLEICAKIKYKTLDTKQTDYTISSQRTQMHALPSSLCKSAARENGQHSVRTRSYHLTVEKKKRANGPGNSSTRPVLSHVLSLPKGCRSIREVIRWKHYSIREERDGNPYAQYDPQSQKAKAGGVVHLPLYFLPPVSARTKLDLMRSGMSSGLTIGSSPARG